MARSRRSKLQQLVRILPIWLPMLSYPTVEPASAAQQTPVVLQLVDQTDVSAAGALIALKAGLFAQHDLAVHIEKAERDDTRLQNGGALVIRLENAREFLISRAAGAPVVAIASNYIDSSVVFYSRRDRKVRSPDDLAGKKIGYNAASDTGLVFEWFLARNPLSRSSMTEMANRSGPDGILDNTLDVLVGHVGVEDLDLERRGVPYDVLDPRQYGVHIPGTAYLTSEANIRENPETIVRFLRALIAGWDLVYADVARAASLLTAPGGQQGEVNLLRRSLERQRELLRPAGVRFGEILKHKWSELYVYMFQKRLIRSPVDLSRATDAKLLNEAYRAGAVGRTSN